MSRSIILCILLLPSIALAESPHWLWSSANRRTNRADVSMTVNLNGPTEWVKVWIGVDFCHATLKVNKKTVRHVHAYGKEDWIETGDIWKPGANTVSVSGRGLPQGPRALAVAIRAKYRNGKIQQWSPRASQRFNQPLINFGRVRKARFDPTAYSIAIDSFDDYTQWKQASGAKQAAAPSKFLTAKGFEVQLVRTAREDEGSWIAATFDPQGRLLVSREDQGIWRMTLNKLSGQVESRELVNQDLRECRGLLFAHGALYASANNSKALYRLKDTNNDGKFDEVKSLRQLPGGVGHGRNDLTLGPDGRIYWICGDSVQIPRKNILDYTSPHREHRQGKNSSEGFVLKTDKDGKSWEVLAAGLRNPYGLAFNDVGDLFTYDADAEFDMGSPWYRPTRVVQILHGADYGWRGVTGRWPPYYPDHPDNAPPAFDVGKGSPTAIAFGKSIQFPAPYDKALFILDWAYGRILAVHCTPRGAGYTCRAETFVKGRPFNVTDLTFGPDGSMYVTTGGRKTRSAIYRIRYRGPVRSDAMTLQQIAREQFSTSRRIVRQRLASYLPRPAKLAMTDAAHHLSDQDPVIRYAAMQVLEHAPINEWEPIVDRIPRNRPGGPLISLMLRAKVADVKLSEISSKYLLPQVEPSSETISKGDFTLPALYAAKLALARSQKITAGSKKKFARVIAKHFPSARYRHDHAAVDRLTAELLLKLNPAEYTSKVVAQLLRPHTQHDLMHYLFILRDVKQGWTMTDRRTYFSVLQSTALFQGGQGMPGFLNNIRRDATAHLPAEIKKQLGDLLSKKQFQFRSPSTKRALVKKWSVADLKGTIAQTGDAKRGKTVFAEALCANCHRKGNFGYPVGPELSSVASRFGRLDILRSILEPSRVVAENYRTVQVVTTDGKIHSGRLVSAGDYRLPTLRLNTNPLNLSQVVDIPKKNVQSYRRVAISPMPKGLLDHFTAKEIVDLLTYLTSGK